MAKKLRQKLTGQDMFLDEKNKISEFSKFSILPFTQTQKLWKSWKVFFYLNFDSCCNSRFRNDKNELRQNLKGQDMILEEKWKFLRFWSFQFSPTSKIKISEVLESVLLL